MNLKYSGFLFVLIVLLEAISGLALSDASVEKNHTKDLSAIHPTTEKTQSEIGSTTESVKIIIHNTPEIIPKSKLNESDLMSVSTTTVNSTNTKTAAATTTTITTPIKTSTPTPTPTPTPAPAPEMGRWVVRYNGTNTTCIIATMAMQLNITYSGNNQLESAILNVPGNASASGNCSESLQSLKIMWGPGHSLTINFNANKTTNKFFISEFSLNVNATVFKNSTDNETWHYVNRSSEFMTPLEMSYKCSKVQDINLEKDGELKAVLSLKGTQFEAFMNKTKPEFGEAQDCDTFDTPDVVPIAVGCALAILVLVVLVAYLIGRKRSHNRGYLSM